MKSKKSKKASGFKSLQCKYCDTVCTRVDEQATAITCWKCTMQLVDGKFLEVRK